MVHSLTGFYKPFQDVWLSTSTDPADTIRVAERIDSTPCRQMSEGERKKLFDIAAVACDEEESFLSEHAPRECLRQSFCRSWNTHVPT